MEGIVYNLNNVLQKIIQNVIFGYKLIDICICYPTTYYTSINFSFPHLRIGWITAILGRVLSSKYCCPAHHKVFFNSDALVVLAAEESREDDTSDDTSDGTSDETSEEIDIEDYEFDTDIALLFKNDEMDLGNLCCKQLSIE